MKPHFLFFALALQFLSILTATGQTKTLSRAYQAKQFELFKNTDPHLGHHNFFAAMAAKMHLADAEQMVLHEAVEGKNGGYHYKYHQQLNGLPIFGTTYVLHERNGVVESASGRYVPRAEGEANPRIHAGTATAAAKSAMKATHYASDQLAPALCYIDPAFPAQSNTLRLAYQVDLASTVPFDKRRYFVDALTGQVLCNFPLILFEGVPSTAKTKYYGTRNITTDSLGPNDFKLHDPTRGEGITVANTSFQVFSNTSSAWDLTNDNQDEVALDAHFCTQEYYDLMLADYDWSGLDGNGKALNVLVHNNGAGEVNAFWDGTNTNYGDGNCVYGPLTTLEVVGHEFTHGMIDHTSQLVYSAESGAINESLADIFGKILERSTDPANFDWDLGHSFILTDDGKPFRVMDDPLSVDMPAYYQGANWQDFADVHTNSSIGNYWFTVLADGKQGTNEVGYEYDVPGIGMDRAGQIVFLTNRAYLTEDSDYNDFANSSIQAAAEIYGQGSAEQLAVEEAWRVVGLPTSSGNQLDIGLSGTYVLTNSCSVNEYLPISFFVENKGDVAYEPSMGASVTLTDFNENLQPYTLAVSEPIAPGEVLEIIVNDWFIASESGTEFVNVDLEFTDDDMNNHYSWVAYNIAEHAANDLTLNMSYIADNCFSPTLDAFFFIYNQSCEELPAGTAMTARAENGDGSFQWSGPIQFEFGLPSFVGEVVWQSIDITSFPKGEALRFWLDYPSDPDPSNNESGETYWLPKDITSDYFNGFDNLQPDWSLRYEYYNDPFFELQGEDYFAITGLYDDPSFLTHCPDFQEIFEDPNNVTGSINACVDFSAHAQPYLDFDLLLYRNSDAEAEGFQYSSMLEVKWLGNSGQSSDILFGQSEGQPVHHGYPLPPNFKGMVSLNFYAEAGQWELMAENLPHDDFVLVDNLRFRTSLSATDEVKNGEAVTLSPNPATASVNIQSTGTMQSLRLLDVGGQVVEQRQVSANQAELDMSRLGAGFYLLHVEMEDGQWAVQKLVKR